MTASSNSPVYYLDPGYVMAPAQPVIMAAVIASGVAVSIYDPRRRRGGICHYAFPRRSQGRSTPHFAAPSIVALVEIFTRAGTNPEHLEAHLYGGGENPRNPRHVPGLSRQNVQAGLDVLRRLRVPVAGRDTGGQRGRQLIFHSGTGEVIMARLDRIDDDHWYPALPN